MTIYLIYKDVITEADLVSLIGLPGETDWLDIKEYVYTRKPDDIWKADICEDIAAFANANGGVIVIGMNSQNGAISDLNGVGPINVDAEILRMKEVVDNGIAPLVQGVRFQPVAINDAAKIAAIVIQVPKSLIGPHRVERHRLNVNTSAQIFKIRHSNGNTDMSLDELRMGFTRQESLAKRIRDFHTDRVSLLELEDHEAMPVVLVPATRIILHSIPFSFDELNTSIDLSPLDSEQMLPWAIEKNLNYGRFNIDGFVRPNGHENGRDGVDGYLQIFRNGVVELTDSIRHHPDNGELSLPAIEDEILAQLGDALFIQRHMGIVPPLVIMVGLTRIGGHPLRSGQRRFDRDIVSSPHRITTILVPETVINDFGIDLKVILKPTFNMLWNAGGFSRSMSYDRNGQWIPRD